MWTRARPQRAQSPISVEYQHIIRTEPVREGKGWDGLSRKDELHFTSNALPHSLPPTVWKRNTSSWMWQPRFSRLLPVAHTQHGPGAEHCGKAARTGRCGSLTCSNSFTLSMGATAVLEIAAATPPARKSLPKLTSLSDAMFVSVCLFETRGYNNNNNISVRRWRGEFDRLNAT